MTYTPCTLPCGTVAYVAPLDPMHPLMGQVVAYRGTPERIADLLECLPFARECWQGWGHPGDDGDGLFMMTADGIRADDVEPVPGGWRAMTAAEIGGFCS